MEGSWKFQLGRGGGGGGGGQFAACFLGDKIHKNTTPFIWEFFRGCRIV